MEIDVREMPEGERVDRVLAAFADLGRKEVLTLLCGEEPRDLAESVKNVLGPSADVQKMRWGLEELPWVLHLKRSLAPSAYHPEEA